MGTSEAIRELRERLSELESAGEALSDEYEALGALLETNREERSALRVALRSLGAEHDAGRESAEEVPRTRARRRPEMRQRPKIRVIARRLASSHDGVLRVRELLRETRAHGFKSDQGGLHTLLSGLKEFEHCGPGRFMLCVDDECEDGED